MSLFPLSRPINRGNLRSAVVSRFIARPLRYTGSHHWRRGLSPFSFHIDRGTRVLPLRSIPQELLVRRLPGYFPVVVRLDAVLDPGAWNALVVVVCSMLPAPEWMGSAFIPNSGFLGAMCLIQGYTLHLAALATSPFLLSDSVVSLPGG